jgi:uncharacterized protein YbjT (DUF2867 family)
VPVLITGASGMVGRALAKRLITEGAQVRAYVRRDDAELRALGVHIAIGAMDDVPKLESALTRVHTIVHLIGGIWPESGMSYDRLNRDSTEAAVIAAHAAGVRRFVFLSFVGADPASTNDFLKAKGLAEQHITEQSNLEHAIFRCAPITEGLGATLQRLGRGKGAGIPGSGEQRLNPLALDDVIDALWSADSRESAVNGTWELGGPDVITMGEAAARVLPDQRQVRAGVLARAPKALLEVYVRDMVADPSAATAQFGLTLRTAS